MEAKKEEGLMESGPAALLVSRDEETLLALKRSLEKLGMQIHVAQSCRQARTLLGQPNPPELVFSDPTLSDGTWADIVSSAAQASNPVPVIVVSKAVDYKLYIDALGGGAADFIMPPFMALDVAFVVRKVRQKALDPGHRTALPVLVA